MSFTTAPKNAPAPVEGALSASQFTARERAIAKLTASAPQTPVENPTKVAAEEMGALKTRQTTTPESDPPAAAPEVTPAKQEEPLSSQYAQLARKEKALRMQAQQVKAQNEALAAREAAIKAKETEYQGDSYIPKDRLSKDTLRTLEEAGISYEQLTQEMLNAPSPEARQLTTTISRLEAKIAALEDGQNKVKQTFEESQQNAYKQAVNQIRTEAKHAVYTDPAFETIKETNSVEDVVELITETFKAEGVLLTVDEAAKAVEDHLAEEAFKLTKLSKIQKRLAANAGATATPAASGKQAEAPSGKQTTMKTLTNRDGTARKLTASERAILAFKGELGK